MAIFPATASYSQHYGSSSIPQSERDLEAGSLAATMSGAESMPVTLTCAAAQHRYDYGAHKYDAAADEDQNCDDEDDDDDLEAGRGRSGPLGKRPRDVGRGLRGGQFHSCDCHCSELAGTLSMVAVFFGGIIIFIVAPNWAGISAWMSYNIKKGKAGFDHKLRQKYDSLRVSVRSHNYKALASRNHPKEMDLGELVQYDSRSLGSDYIKREDFDGVDLVTIRA